MKTLPNQLKKEGFNFAKLLGKNPSIGGDDWQNQIHSWQEAEIWLNQGYNYGVMGGFEDLIILDTDSQSVSDVVMMSLPITFTVMTGSGKMHFYFFCPELHKKVIFNDKLEPSQFQEGEDHYGEIITKGFQAVGPGSIHPDSRKDYEVLFDEEIATVSKEQVLLALKQFLKPDKPEVLPREAHGTGIDSLKIIDILPEVTSTSVIVHPVHGAEGAGNLSLNLEENLWHCFRCDSGGNALSLFAVMEGLVDCADATGSFLRGEQFIKVRDAVMKKFPQLAPKEKDPFIEEEDNDPIILMSEITSFLPETPSFSSGFSSLDAVLDGGFHIGDLVGISGHGGQGKTFFAQSITKSLGDNKIPSLWFSQEMSLRELWNRFLDMGVDKDFLAYIPTKMSSMDLAWVEKKIVQALQKNPEIKAVFYDHLGYLEKKVDKYDSARSSNQQSYLNMICRELKKIALKYNIVVFLIAHCRKTIGIPGMQDVADSSGVAREADVIFTVYRKEIEKDDGDTLVSDPVTVVSLVKNRRTGLLQRVLMVKGTDTGDKTLQVVSKSKANKIREEYGFLKEVSSLASKRMAKKEADSDFKNIYK